MESWGFDGNVTTNHNFTKDFGMTVRGNWTFARNNVTYWEQSGVVYPYQSFVDVPYGVKRGLISLGLFKDQADIESSLLKPILLMCVQVTLSIKMSMVTVLSMMMILYRYPIQISQLFSMVLLLNSDTNSLLPAFSLKV